MVRKLGAMILSAVLLSAVLILSLSACGSTADTNENNAGTTGQQESAAESSVSSGGKEAAVSSAEPSLEDEQPARPSGKSDTLVVYFSRTGEQYTVGVIDEGNTAIVAKMIAEQTGADSFEVLPADDHYPLTYEELMEVAKREQNENARPEYAGEVPDLSQYSTIFIGSPVWWGDWPMIMYTFLENNSAALAGKTLIPFSTHEGSGLAGFDTKLSAAFPDSTILEGFAVRGNDAQNQRDSVRESVKNWISELKL